MTQFGDARQRWDLRFEAADGFLFGSEPNRWLVSAEPWLPRRARVLSVADGEGRNSVWLAAQGHRVTAFDLSPVGVARAREFAASREVAVEFHLGDAAAWAWEHEVYDAVAAIFIQFAPPELRERIFAGIAQVLAPGGVLILEGYGPRQMDYKTGGPGILEHLYTVPMLLAAFPDWTILASRDGDARLDEGAGHKGVSHLVSMVLRKPPH